MRHFTFGILASGKLGATCLRRIIKKEAVRFVFTDKLSFEIINLCEKCSIPVFIGTPRDGKAKKFIENLNIDVLLSVNYLYIIEQDILEIPKKIAVNFHGSLLPKYRGRTPHIWAIINNEKETGITAHLMTEKCDEGDIIYQEKIIISENSTGADLLNEYNKLYPIIIFKVIKMIKKNTLEYIKQDEKKAVYFGKRTPDDGEINWNWQKERIRNWVRALSKPYPGAFTYYGGHKVIINNIEFSDLGFCQDDVNGKILNCTDIIIVKTPNGAVELKDIQIYDDVKFQKGGNFKCAKLT